MSTSENDLRRTPSAAPAPQTLILGLGNILLTDEGAGPEAVRRLEAESPSDSGCTYLDGGTLSFSLAVPLGEHPRLIVIDAAVMGDPPGAIRVFEGEAMDRQLSRHANSVHEVSLSDLLDMARLTDSLPRRRALIGVEPAAVDWGDRLSPAVEAAIPEIVARAQALVARWDREDGDSA